MTGKDTIRSWLLEGKNAGASYVIVACDTFDYEDYPVFVGPNDSFGAAISRASTNMQRPMEVYDLSLDFESQLNEYRAWHSPKTLSP
jgi:hypothetical protein